MVKSAGINIWEREYANYVSYQKCYPKMILQIGRIGIDFDFLECRGRYFDNLKLNNDPYCNPFLAQLEKYPNEEIKKVIFSAKYLKLPDSARKIEYIFKYGREGNEIYVVIDYPAFNFKYDNHRFFFVDFKGGTATEATIKSFQRFRDGGTTIIEVETKERTEYRLISPQTMFPNNSQNPTLTGSGVIDTELITDISDEEITVLIKILDLQIAPDYDKEGNSQYM